MQGLFYDSICLRCWVLFCQQLNRQMNIIQNNEKTHDTQYQSSSSGSSIEEWRHTYVSRNRRKPLGSNNSFLLNRSEIVTEKSMITKQKTEKNTQNRQGGSMNILVLKERIAHYVSLLKSKDEEISELRECITRMGQAQRLKQKHAEQLQRVIQTQCQSLVQQKAEVNVLYSSIKSNEQDIEMQKLDNELLLRHVNFYKSEIVKLKQELVSENKKQKQLHVRLEEMSKLKTENARLTEDVLRIKFLLRESDKYKKLATKIQYKHYVARKTTESDNWISGQLMDDVKKLTEKLEMKVDQRKKFEEHTMRFINKYVIKGVEEESKKIKKQYKAKLKNLDKQKHYFSLNKSSRPEHSKKQKSGFTHSVTEVQGCLRPYPLSRNKMEMCSRILKELKQKVVQQLEQKQISKARIRIVIDWATDAILGMSCSQLEDEKSVINKTMNTTNFL